MSSIGLQLVLVVYEDVLYTVGIQDTWPVHGDRSTLERSQHSPDLLSS